MGKKHVFSLFAPKRRSIVGIANSAGLISTNVFRKRDEPKYIPGDKRQLLSTKKKLTVLIFHQALATSGTRISIFCEELVTHSN